MPDDVKGKKIGDFGYWIKLRSELGDATIVAFKRPESEKKAIGAEVSLTEAKMAGQYRRETESNVWDTIIATREHGVLPIETWKTKAGMEKIVSAITVATGSTSVVISQPVFVPIGSLYHCENCGEPIVFTPADGLCPSCGKRFTV